MIEIVTSLLIIILCAVFFTGMLMYEAKPKNNIEKHKKIM